MSSFEGVSSDHRIITATICLSLYRNKKQSKPTHFDWSSPNNRDISDEYLATVRNKFDIFQEISETHTLNDECENFVTAHIEATAEYIPTKPTAKCRVP